MSNRIIPISLVIVLIACSEKTNNVYTTEFLLGASPGDSSLVYIPILALSGDNPFSKGMPDSLRTLCELDFADCSQLCLEFADFITESDSSWQYVDNKVRLELNNWTSHRFYYFIAQNSSNRMLWLRLLNDPTVSTNRQVSVEFYVNLALKYGHPDAEIFARALPFLHAHTYWSTSQVESAASDAHNFANNYLNISDPNKFGNEDSTSSAYVHEPIDAKAAKRSKIEDAIVVLDSLASL